MFINVAYDYETGERLGRATKELAKESKNAGDTGAVSAYRHCNGWWCYAQNTALMKSLGERVVTVFVRKERV